MLRPFLKPWRAIQRAEDVRRLWPALRANARERYPNGDHLERARAAFREHADRSPAWLALDPAERRRRIDELE